MRLPLPEEPPWAADQTTILQSLGVLDPNNPDYSLWYDRGSWPRSFWNHPVSFFLFAVPGAGLIGADMLLYLWSVATSEE